MSRMTREGRIAKAPYIASQLAAIAIGLWLMAAPAVLGYAGTPIAAVHRVAGPIAAALAFVALSQATQAVRRGNALAGVVLVIAAPVAWHDAASMITGIVAGVLIALLGLVPGGAGPRLGGGWSALLGRA